MTLSIFKSSLCRILMAPFLNKTKEWLKMILKTYQSQNPLFVDGRVKPDITPPSMAQASVKMINIFGDLIDYKLSVFKGLNINVSNQ